MKTDPLTTAYEQFLIDGDPEHLLSAIHEFGGVAPSPDIDFPLAHRLCDITIHGLDFRVVRIVDADGSHPRLSIYETAVASEDPGVPYWLQGEALGRWMYDESENPADDDIDWEKYRDADD